MSRYDPAASPQGPQEAKEVQPENSGNLARYLKGAPCVRATVLAIYTLDPRKPNSAKPVVTALVPGEGHRIQEYATVLVRPRGSEGRKRQMGGDPRGPRRRDTGVPPPQGPVAVRGEALDPTLPGFGT
jgi:hypothetical protein